MARGISRAVRETAEGCLGELDRVGSSISILLTDQEGIQAYNQRFLDRARPTDVLAFPGEGVAEEGRPYLGDIVISVEQAGEQAPEYGNTLEEEVRTLVIHGVLHLLGMDHETDSGEMHALEEDLRGRLIRTGER